MSPYHRWLISHRIFCEHPGCLMHLRRATKVINKEGKDYVYCAFHSYKPKTQIEQPTNETLETK